MEYTIDISEAAEDDIRNAFLWYEDKKDGLGVDFQIHMEQAVKSIKDSPLKTQIRYENIRVFFLKKFPYGIHFKVSDKSILIVGVFASKDNPEKWKHRQ